MWDTVYRPAWARTGGTTVVLINPLGSIPQSALCQLPEGPFQLFPANLAACEQNRPVTISRLAWQDEMVWTQAVAAMSGEECQLPYPASWPQMID